MAPATSRLVAIVVFPAPPFAPNTRIRRQSEDRSTGTFPIRYRRSFYSVRHGLGRLISRVKLPSRAACRLFSRKLRSGHTTWSAFAFDLSLARVTAPRGGWRDPCDFSQGRGSLGAGRSSELH